MLKTYKNWRGNMDEYLHVGDVVDVEMKDYFINVLPPETLHTDLIQIGEPYSHINGRATFSTLAKINNQWMYKGHCFSGSGETIH